MWTSTRNERDPVTSSVPRRPRRFPMRTAVGRRRAGRRRTRSRKTMNAPTTAPPAAATTTGAGGWARSTTRASLPASTGAIERRRRGAPFVGGSSWISSRSPMGGATILPVAEGLLVEAIDLDDPPAHRLHAAVHGGVDLEDPPHLAAFHDAALRLVEVLDVELRGHAGVLELRLDAQCEDAHMADLVAPAHELEPAGREQPALHPDQDLVPVEQRERRPRGLSVLFGDPSPA